MMSMASNLAIRKISHEMSMEILSSMTLSINDN